MRLVLASALMLFEYLIQSSWQVAFMAVASMVTLSQGQAPGDLSILSVVPLC